MIGNAYWCKAMTQFIKDQGAQALFAAVSRLNIIMLYLTLALFEFCFVSLPLVCSLWVSCLLWVHALLILTYLFYKFCGTAGVWPSVSPKPSQTTCARAFRSTHSWSASLIQARLDHRHGIRREPSQSDRSTEVEEHSYVLSGQAGREAVYSMFGSSRSDFLLSESVDSGDALRAHASQVWKCL